MVYGSGNLHDQCICKNNVGIGINNVGIGAMHGETGVRGDVAKSAQTLGVSLVQKRFLGTICFFLSLMAHKIQTSVQST